MRNREQKCLEKRKEKDEEKKLRVLDAKKKIEEKEKKVFYRFISILTVYTNPISGWKAAEWKRKVNNQSQKDGWDLSEAERTDQNSEYWNAVK